MDAGFVHIVKYNEAYLVWNGKKEMKFAINILLKKVDWIIKKHAELSAKAKHIIIRFTIYKWNK